MAKFQARPVTQLSKELYRFHAFKQGYRISHGLYEVSNHVEAKFNVLQLRIGNVKLRYELREGRRQRVGGPAVDRNLPSFDY